MKKLSALALVLVMTVSGNVFAAADTGAGGGAVNTAGGAATGGAASSGLSSGGVAGASNAEIALGVGAADLDRRRFDAGAFAGALFEPFHLAAVVFGPPDIHAQQNLGPVLGLGAAGPGMDLEITVIGVGFARQQALELALGDFGAELLQVGLGLGDDGLVALGLAELDEAELIVELALDAAVAGDRVVELGALTQQRLRRLGLVPELRVLGLGVQLVKPPRCTIPVKDASSAGRGRRVPPRPLLRSPRAWRTPFTTMDDDLASV